MPITEGGYYTCGRCRAVRFMTIKRVRTLVIATCRFPGCGHVHRTFQ